MLTSRQKLILKAIVDKHSEDGIAISSASLVGYPNIEASPATLRAEMAILEAYGFLEKPHTSAGRIPSKLGYKYYVENLITRDQEITSMFPLIDEVFMKNKYSKTSAVSQALELLAGLTKYTALAVGPDTHNSKIKRIDFIPTTKSEAIILIVTDHGHVSHQSIEIEPHQSVDDLKDVIRTLDDLLKDKYLYDAIELIKNETTNNQIDQFMTFQSNIVDTFLNAFAQFTTDNLYLTGINNVFRQPDFDNVAQIKSLMEMLDRKEILRLVGTSDNIQLRFGNDVAMFPVDNMTIISVPFITDHDQKGMIALLGPTRMAYSKIVPLLEYIAANIAKLYKEDEEETDDE